MTGVFKSLDAGATWTPKNTGLVYTEVLSLAMDPSNPLVLYAGAGGYSNLPTPLPGGGLFRTADGGDTWQATGLTGVGVKSIAVDPASPSVIYAAPYSVPVMSANNGRGVWKSVDAGPTWSQALSQSGPGFDSIALAITEPRNVYAAWFCCSVFKSTDGGASWLRHDFTDGFAPVTGLAIDPVRASHVYVSTDTGVYHSPDEGLSWSALSCGLPPEVKINDLAIAGNGLSLFAATRDDGVLWYSVSDGGSSEPCAAGTLCLYGARFCAELLWRSPDGRSGTGHGIALSGGSGVFGFSNPPISS